MPQVKLEAPKFAVEQKTDDTIIGWTQGKGYDYNASLKKLQSINESLGTLADARAGKRETERAKIAPYAEQIVFEVAARSHVPVENRLVALQIIAKLGSHYAADAQDPLTRVAKDPQSRLPQDRKKIVEAAHAALDEIERAGGEKPRDRRRRRMDADQYGPPSGSGGFGPVELPRGRFGKQLGAMPRLP